MLRLNADKSKSYFYRFVYGHIPAAFASLFTHLIYWLCVKGANHFRGHTELLLWCEVQSSGDYLCHTGGVCNLTVSSGKYMAISLGILMEKVLSQVIYCNFHWLF